MSERTVEYRDAPFVTCPVCKSEQVENTYFEMGKGSEVDCRKCHATLVCASVESVMHWAWKAKGEG